MNRGSVRVRLTLVYGGLFLITGLGLLTTTYVLVDRTTSTTESATFSFTGVASEYPPEAPLPQGPVKGDPPPRIIGPSTLEHDPSNPDTAFTDVVSRELERRLKSQQAEMMRGLLTNSGIALAVMLLVAVGLGWILAGRVLRPLRTVTATVQEISHSNLHRRLAASGPRDEFRELSDTFDELLDRLEGSFEAQRRFVANASHELRTPLARQRVIAQVTLSDPDASEESLRHAHERVLASGEEQERILEALLTLARGQQAMEQAELCDLAEVVAAVLVRRDATPGVTLESDLVDAPLVGDPALLERLVANLLDNACVHNDGRGRVRITTGRVDGASVLTVTNTGPTIPAASLGRLLEPFRRLAADRTKERQGLGLGLSIVSAICGSHGASLDLVPGEDGGLDVTVRFPQP